MGNEIEERSLPVASAVASATAVLAACGGGGGSDGARVGDGGAVRSTSSTSPSAAQASRFLSQAAFGATEADITYVQSVGYEAWIEEQFTAPTAQSHWDWMIANGWGKLDFKDSVAGVDATLWRKLMSSPDPLRQRVALALSEIFVISMAGLPVQWPGMAVAAYMDMLEAHAFGNVRSLLESVTLSCGMGVYLSMRGSQKEDAATGRQPDENYAREVMQLFTIGLCELNADGTPRMHNGASVETYDQADVTGLAKVFTGWDFDAPVTGRPDHMRRPMAFNAARHSTSAKSFLGVVLAAGGTDGVGEMKTVLDTLFNHPNGGPFIGRQLIQRLVTSNPSPAYVGRVAAAYANNGRGVRGDLKAVLKAVLLDDEARNVATSGCARLREPICRLVQWARSFGAWSPKELWDIGDTSEPSTRLGQSPMRSPSVFNFFRPGYVPPNTRIGKQGLVAPEFQVANESTLVGYANWIQAVIQNGRGDVRADYGGFTDDAGDAAALFDRINLVLAAGQLSTLTRSIVVNAVSTIDASTALGRLRRVQATVLLVMTAPEYLIAK